jgi:mono/diheme cytochrome c family protein
MRGLWPFSLLCAATLLLTGCKDQLGPDDGESPSNVIFPAAAVSYSQHVQVLFNQTCAISGCHDDGSHQSALRLTSYENLRWNAPQVEVVPSEPNASVLVLRIEGRLGDRMPLYKNSLNDNQINGIRAWIVEGALNN